jgi:hypothetical protein
MQARRSSLQRRVLFSSVYAHLCVDWQLASEWNANAGSPSCSPAKSELRFVPEFGIADSRRAVPMRVLLTFMGALFSWGVPGPGPNMRMPMKNVLGWAHFSGTPMWTPGKMRALYGSWACICAAAPGSVSVPVRAPASVDRFQFLFPFVCRCWLLLGRHRAFRFCLVFFSGRFIMCPLPTRRSGS